MYRIVKGVSIGIVAIVLVSVGCNSDIDKGANALAKNDFASATEFYGKAYAKDANSIAAKEGLATAYLLHAQKIYNRQKKRAIKMEVKAEELFDSTMSVELKTHFCDFFLISAAALLEDGKNKKALDKLEYANATFGPNKKISQDYTAISVKYAAHMLKMGQEKYTEYRKTKNDFKLLYAENYLTFALKYNAQLTEAKTLAGIVRKKTLGMDNPEDRILFSVPAVKRRAKYVLLNVYIKSNHIAVDLNTTPTNFKLIDANGIIYSSAPALVKGVTPLPVKQLTAQEEAQGVLAFSLPRGVAIAKLVYDDGTNKVEKYFP